ncbi:MAG: imidazoleglycerol-phosphate dehydratase HisB [Acidimicrobiia bacterium]|jgi:imidazoleglycerol phosphate dehydratase HisB
MSRRCELSRRTGETNVEVTLDLDGSGDVDVVTGLGFMDHMLSALGKHAGFDLTLRARGDLAVDDHHTVEDCAIVLGRALDQALGDRSGITRFGFAYAPLDEALTRVVVDLSGRPWPEIALPFSRDSIGAVATENIIHFFRSLSLEARMALHVDLIRGDNDHHKAESAFKALALALRAAVAPSDEGVPSTKGSLG